MRTLRGFLTIVMIGWAIAAAVGLVALIGWLRERYGRGGPIPPSQAQMLLTPMRRLTQTPEGAMQTFGVREGDTVLELGPGPGYFSIEASQAVGPTGRVLCVDLQAGMLSVLAERLREAGATNARPVLGDATRLPLATASCDRAYLVTVIGEIPDRPAALRELRRVLKQGGLLAFSETLGDPDYMPMGWLEDLCRSHGFERLDETGMLLGYTLTFRAPGGAEG
jgi:SAM-dependent methyltransferase